MVSEQPDAPAALVARLPEQWRKFAGECRRTGQYDAADTAVLCAEDLERALAALGVPPQEETQHAPECAINYFDCRCVCTCKPAALGAPSPPPPAQK